jgi:hypothetical protein
MIVDAKVSGCHDNTRPIQPSWRSHSPPAFFVVTLTNDPCIRVQAKKFAHDVIMFAPRHTASPQACASTRVPRLKSARASP